MCVNLSAPSPFPAASPHTGPHPSKTLIQVCRHLGLSALPWALWPLSSPIRRSFSLQTSKGPGTHPAHLLCPIAPFGAQLSSLRVPYHSGHSWYLPSTHHHDQGHEVSLLYLLPTGWDRLGASGCSSSNLCNGPISQRPRSLESHSSTPRKQHRLPLPSRGLEAIVGSHHAHIRTSCSAGGSAFPPHYWGLGTPLIRCLR